MQFKHLLCLLVLCNSFLAPGQSNYYTQSQRFLKANAHWVFGDSAGINFNAPQPVAMHTSNFGNEGSVAVSDPETGELLFYSNGAKCWKANGQLMLHGDSLLGNGSYYWNSTTPTSGNISTSQGVCVVPVINDPDKYYLFSLSTYASHPNTLYYSVVDRKLDNGAGDIDPARKNILLDKTQLSEAMVAVPGDCNDVWLLVHDFKYPDFRAYHITANGIDTTPVVSTIGNTIPDRGPAATYNAMAVSPDRRRIAITGRVLSDEATLLCQFDPASGVLSNHIKIMGIAPIRTPQARFATDGGYGICFSPDNTKLYITTTEYGILSAKMRLCQFDVSNFDSTAIARSKYAVYETELAIYAAPGIRLYNGAIYLCVRAGVGSNPEGQINKINNPNIAGAGCNYQERAIVLAPNTQAWLTLGGEVVYAIADTVYQHNAAADTVICTGSTTVLDAPAGFDDYQWNGTTAGTSFSVTEAGRYWVSYRDSCYHYTVDSFWVSELEFIAPVITVDSFVLGTATSYASYQWLLNGTVIAGATDSVYTAGENGDYQVIVTNSSGCMDTSDVYPVRNVSIIDNFQAVSASIALYPNPARDRMYIKAAIPVTVEIRSLSGRTVARCPGGESLRIGHLATGMYLVSIRDRGGRLLKVDKFVKVAP